MWNLTELKNLELLAETNDSVLTDILEESEIEVINKTSKNGMAVKNLSNRVIIPLSWKNNKRVRVILSLFNLNLRNNV